MRHLATSHSSSTANLHLEENWQMPSKRFCKVCSSFTKGANWAATSTFTTIILSLCLDFWVIWTPPIVQVLKQLYADNEKDESFCSVARRRLSRIVPSRLQTAEKAMIVVSYIAATHVKELQRMFWNCRTRGQENIGQQFRLIICYIQSTVRILGYEDTASIPNGGVRFGQHHWFHVRIVHRVPKSIWSTWSHTCLRLPSLEHRG